MGEAHAIEKEQEVADNDAWPPAALHCCGREPEKAESGPSGDLTSPVRRVPVFHGLILAPNSLHGWTF